MQPNVKQPNQIARTTHPPLSQWCVTAFAFIAIVFFSSCSQQSDQTSKQSESKLLSSRESGEEVVASVGGYPIFADFAREQSTRSNMASTQEVIDDLVTLDALSQEALRRGYRPPALLLAFGPGLSVESLPIRPAAER